MVAWFINLIVSISDPYCLVMFYCLLVSGKTLFHSDTLNIAMEGVFVVCLCVCGGGGDISMLSSFNLI